MQQDKRDGADDTGRTATSPFAIPAAGWKQVLWRSWSEAGDDNVGLIAAGVAFYGFLALVPLLGAVVLVYGLVADPQTVIDNVRSLAEVLPADAAKLVGEQLMGVVQTSGSSKGLGLLVALGIALFGARNGAGSIMTALNIAYEEKEKRNFFIVNLTALAITVGAVIGAIVAMVAIAALGHLDALIPGAPAALLWVGRALTYILLFLGGAAGAATLFRYGPSRRRPRWVWLTPGSLLAATGWLVLTLGFGIYVANFGNYDATYGSLGTVVVLLTWLYLSAYILLLAAELNAELEHQTARDSTSGGARPMGARGAWVADHVAPEAAKATPAAPAAARPSRPASSASSGTARGVLAAGRLAPLAGAKRPGLVPAGMAALGLGLIRKPGRAAQGAALLGTAGLVAWLRRERPPRKPLARH